MEVWMEGQRVGLGWGGRRKRLEGGVWVPGEGCWMEGAWMEATGFWMEGG